MLPASVKKMIRRKSLQCSIDSEEPTAEQYLYRRQMIDEKYVQFANLPVCQWQKEKLENVLFVTGLSCWAPFLLQHCRLLKPTFVIIFKIEFSIFGSKTKVLFQFSFPFLSLSLCPRFALLTFFAFLSFMFIAFCVFVLTQFHQAAS